MGALQNFSKDELEHLIEEKIYEIADDPDSGLEVKEDYAKLLEKRKKEEASLTHEEIVEDFG
jgi:hypothetical protein